MKYEYLSYILFFPYISSVMCAVSMMCCWIMFSRVRAIEEVGGGNML